MQAAQLTAFGPAADVLRVVDLPDPVPGPGQVVVEMIAAPINPADLNIIEGKYGELPALPAILGNEGSGRIAALGPGVTGLSVGDLVLTRTFGNWTRRLLAKAADVLRLPANVDPLQASMFMVNPPTAWAMMEDFVTLQPGDWLVQNAANSAVGRSVIQLARARGIRTLNIVRRPELIDELTALGADIVVTEDIDLRKETSILCGGARPRLAFNAVGGASALNLANALQDGGTHVTYGAMGRQPLKLPNGLLIFRLLTFTGFWLRRWNETATREQLDRVFGELSRLSAEGALHLPIHRTYPLAEIQAALDEAARESRAGKVLLDLTAA